MPHYVGLDVSKRSTAICVLNHQGTIVQEAVAETHPRAITQMLRGKRRRYAIVGLEASAPDWLVAGLQKARFVIALVEARRAHAVLKGLASNKTDQNDARGIAELVRLGAYRPVHRKSDEARRLRLLLTARSLLVRKATDISAAVSGIMSEYGIAVRVGQRSKFVERARAAAAGVAELEKLIDRVAPTYAGLHAGITAYDRDIADAVRSDPVCVLLMTAPGVGVITSAVFRSAVDDPGRFARSRDVAAHFGLTPRVWQIGEVVRPGGISRWGDAEVRKALFISAIVLLKEGRKGSSLRDWGLQVCLRRGRGKGSIAVARRLATILHRMWVDGTEFQWAGGSPAGAQRGRLCDPGVASQVVSADARSTSDGQPRPPEVAAPNGAVAAG